MKTIKILLISLFVCTALTYVNAQSNEISSEIISALDEGNASEINNNLSANVELVIGNKNDVFSKQQASGIINDFFRTNKVSSFQVIHKGNKDAASFAIGTLKTSGGSFRVYVLTRKQGSTPLIQQLRIESSND
jgi:archaellum component FlaF (FlaF/FlaG flagellin family)